ncbi:LysR family transcriptional regulator [Saccharopolyspora elongata]|uniref:LysR family transcriptional regulator n=1 Tax=Saccharopolyspora elongata TaxID=2530387 RepID=A0A4R4Z2F3_9PSEU|nr:LysR family transcriptional regulator [Saccharopolyspora elongata]TDD52181.1 LysR family transcriptional regulator [Saccharopolyspora elongata]
MAKLGGSGNPSIQQIRLFLLLAEELHFGRAAARAFMAQPTFSRHIKSLERDLGVALVDRTSRRVALSAAGEALQARMRAVVHAMQELRREADAQAGSGRIVIGSFEAITSLPPIPAILDELRRRLPQLEVQVLRTGFDATEAVSRGDVDAAFLFLPVPNGIRALPLDSGPRCAAMPADDPLAAEGPLALADLADREHIGWSDRVPKVYQDFWAVDPRPGGRPARYSPHAMGDFESGLQLIAMGGGLLFPPTVGRELYPRPGVSYVDVTDLEPWTSALAWLPANHDKPFVAALRKAARAVLSRTCG